MWSEWKELIPASYVNDYDGPATYELCIYFPMVTSQVVYVGETNCLRRRMGQHDTGQGSDIHWLIERARFSARVGYHYVTRSSKSHAMRSEGKLLGQFYEWNKKGNHPSNPPRDPSLLQKTVEFGLGESWREGIQKEALDRNRRRRK